MRALLQRAPGPEAERVDGLVHRRVARHRQRGERLRGPRLRLADQRTLLRVGLFGQQAVQVALSERRARLAGRRESELRACPVQLVDLGARLAREGECGELLGEEREGAARIVGGGAGRGGVHDLDALALQQPGMLRERARGQRPRPRGPAPPEEVALGGEQRARLFRELGGRRGGLALVGARRGRVLGDAPAGRGCRGRGLRVPTGEGQEKDDEKRHPG